jgi:hypothetical protein
MVVCSPEGFALRRRRPGLVLFEVALGLGAPVSREHAAVGVGAFPAARRHGSSGFSQSAPPRPGVVGAELGFPLSPEVPPLSYCVLVPKSRRLRDFAPPLD